MIVYIDDLERAVKNYRETENDDSQRTVVNIFDGEKRIVALVESEPA